MKLTTLIRRTSMLFFLGSLFAIPGNLFGQLLLNEMMASNASTLEDQFNNFPDWLEIYNSGANAVELNNYWLSDDSTNLKLWNIPPASLTGGAYQLVFASGKDISTGITYWHTVINAGDEWRCVIPTGPIDEKWKTSTSETAAWKTGKSGFGYGDGDDATVLPQAISYYIQKEFQLEAADQLTDAALYIDYDDGFVAYLNGTEIARSANMGDSGQVVSYNATAGNNREATMYGGSSPESYFFTTRLDLLKEGSNILAIEVHNVSSTSSDMSGIPFLLLGFTGIQENLLYKNPYFTVEETFPHTNFKISAGGESIFLSDNDGNIVDKIANVQLPTDFSYGRTLPNTEQFGFFADPTPNAANITQYYRDYITDSVSFFLHKKEFDVLQQVHVESRFDNDAIRYTTDGSEPSKADLLYTGIKSFSKTTVLKARIFRSNSLPGPVSTKTIFVGEGHDLPIISVSMDPDDLWDYNTGIYVMGPNASQEAPNSGANFWQDWERPAHFEIYNDKHELLLAQNAGTKIFGGWSRANDQRSMSFFARSSYGRGSFNYPLFREKPIDSYEAFVLRNGGNDWCNGFFRDALSANMSAKMNVDHQAYEPYVMYLNGEYWGIINMREKINEHFVASNHNLHPEDVNIVEGNGWLVHGSVDTYNRMYDYVTDTDLSDQAAYDSVKTMMDIQNFISYWALNIYIDNKDWPANNNKFWSSSAPGSLYRWISYDTDFGYSIWDGEAYKVNTLAFSLSKGNLTWANQLWATAMMRSLLKNEEFRNQYINEYADRMNTTFHAKNMIPVIDSFQQRIISETPAHYARWIPDPNNWLNYNNWLGFVERMRVFLAERPAYMRQFLKDEFEISGTAVISVNISDLSAGHVKLNSIDLNSFPFEGTYFKKIPIRLEAVPAPGYVFSHWSGEVSTDTTAFHYAMEGGADFIANFEAVDSVTNIVINEINYASLATRNTDDWIELYNNSGVAVDLTGWTISSGFSLDTFAIPDGTIMPSDAYIVFGKNLPDFKQFFPELQPVSGNLTFGLDSDKDGIALNTPEGDIHDYVTYENLAPWPLIAKGSGLTIELINARLDNALPGSWKASLDTTGTPCALNSQYRDVIIGVEEMKNEMFRAYAYPSPFNTSTNISFKLQRAQEISVSVYSSTGSLMEIVANRLFMEGVHSIKWAPEGHLPSGLYFINIKTGTQSQTLKVVFQ